MNLGLYSYLGAALAYGFFAILLLYSLRSLQGRMLFAVVITSLVWAALSASITTITSGETERILAYQSFEVLRYIAWYVFLLRLFYPAAAQAGSFRRFVRWALPLSVGFALLTLVNDLFLLSDQAVVGYTEHVFLALIGLAIIEQLLRNTSVRHRWAIKYLFIGAGGLFAFDFYLYADALLFRVIDTALWEARGIVNLVQNEQELV